MRVVANGLEPHVYCYLAGPGTDNDHNGIGDNDDKLREVLPYVAISAVAENPPAASLVKADHPHVLVGYSAGCQAVRALLMRGADPAAVVTIDGTHASWPPVDWQIAVWRALAGEARRSERIWVATCTQQRYTEHLKAGAFASTRTVLERAIGETLEPGTEIHIGGLHVISYPSANTDAAAHRAQHNQVLPEMLRRYVAPLYPEPLPKPWQDRSLRLGERCVLWCEAERAAGVKETPPGSNTSPRIAWYAAPAYRRTTGEMLRLKALPWCAVAQCAAERECLLPGEAGSMGYYASGLELEAGARNVGLFREAGSGYVPKRGDVGILRRTGSDPQKASWERHVVRVTDVYPETSGYRSIGGNEANAWGVAMRRLDGPEVIGWIDVP